ncbi:glycosyltransferase family 2 protein [Butyrivibrio sp. AE3004]|uniref:glycosyltransferase family 2 protein n=1 Tax=Butyrivibrio sp. AE3004 TaxID=1506994 RepID=UPI0018CC5B86|nr:glycosyltransferase [Butyrivibrio sp. AE3004]
MIDNLLHKIASMQIKYNEVSEELSELFESVSPWMQQISQEPVKKIETDDLPNIDDSYVGQNLIGHVLNYKSIIPASVPKLGNIVLHVITDDANDIELLEGRISSFPYITDAIISTSDLQIREKAKNSFNESRSISNVEIRIIPAEGNMEQYFTDLYSTLTDRFGYILQFDFSGQTQMQRNIMNDLCGNELMFRQFMNLLDSDRNVGAIVPSSIVAEANGRGWIHVGTTFFALTSQLLECKRMPLGISRKSIENGYHIALSDFGERKVYFDSDERYYSSCFSYNADELSEDIRGKYEEYFFDVEDVLIDMRTGIIRNDIWDLLVKLLDAQREIKLIYHKQRDKNGTVYSQIIAKDKRLKSRIIVIESNDDLDIRSVTDKKELIYFTNGIVSIVNYDGLDIVAIPEVDMMMSWTNSYKDISSDKNSVEYYLMHYYCAKYIFNSPFAISESREISLDERNQFLQMINEMLMAAPGITDENLKSLVSKINYKGTLGKMISLLFGKSLPKEFGMIKTKLPGDSAIIEEFIDDYIQAGDLAEKYDGIKDSELREYLRENNIDSKISFEDINTICEDIKSLSLKSYSFAIDNRYADYNNWYHEVEPKKKELQEQREYHFEYKPLYSIVIPVYRTKEVYLRRLLDSITMQTYGNFEVCIADASEYEKGSDWKHGEPRTVLKEYSEKDTRIRFEILEKNNGISLNTNAAISMAKGDYVVFADHDDELTVNALFEFTKAINENPWIEFIYSDEDKVDKTSEEFSYPHFKPDFSMSLLESNNYICHLMGIKRSLLEEISENNNGTVIYERKEFDGAQDYDLILRCCEKALSNEASMVKDIVAGNYKGDDGDAFINTVNKLTNEGRYVSLKIHHVPKVLYHWRVYELSTAGGVEDVKPYTVEAGRKALSEHYKRLDIKVSEIQDGVSNNVYHTIYENNNPLVSVIIPSKDHTNDLDKIIRSALHGSYKNIEIIVVENNSTEDETWEYYKNIQKEFSNVKIVYYKGGFNYSKLNNFGVGYASGEYYLFQNNDTEMISEESITEMVGIVQRRDVGIVGARLLYDDDTIQHAGIVVGMCGIASNTFVGIGSDQTYFNYGMFLRDYSAVTAASFMVKKEDYDAVNGFSEDLAVAFNDVDFCLKVRSLGKKVVYNPYALFYHYESKSRGSDERPERIEQFHQEIILFAKKWPEIIKAGDPYYNQNLTLLTEDFGLKVLSRETIGKPCYNELLTDIILETGA